MKHLILGGARSGKSKFAEGCARATGKQLIYLATGEPRDQEMAARIKHHQQSRQQEDWTLIEEPLQLGQALLNADSSQHAIVVDCLTLWLANCLEQACFEVEKTRLLQSLAEIEASVFFVSNEVGSGVVPLGPLSREFVDQAGWLHQGLAERCDQVSLVVAGQNLVLKNTLTKQATL